jgi:Na+/melibiose symporter-like transporter
MCWSPIFGEAESARLANTIWIVCWALVFFATYTMSLIAYYGSLSTVCSTDNQRLRVSSFKSFLSEK